MLLTRLLRELLISRDVARRADLYDTVRSDADRRALQLESLNRQWRTTIASVPYFADMVRSRHLPDRFSCLAEFSALVPATTRANVQRFRSQMTAGRPDFHRVTGGSTQQPIQIPAWNSEFGHTRADTWAGRLAYGIRPSHKQFMIWGHSHLWGRGWKARIRSLDRQLRDLLLGYDRFSAYDLSAPSMRSAALELLRFRPDYLLGYSVALDLFARANLNLRSALRELGLKVVIGAAESFPADSSPALLSDLFGCPTAMEYGSVESGLIAHTVPGSGYSVFWHSYFVDVDPVKSPAGGYRVRITSLFPRCFPLVRYELGDEIQLEGGPVESVFSFRRVLGRLNEYVELDCGQIVHSEAFTHAVRVFSQVRAYQVVVDSGHIGLNLVVDGDLPAGVESSIRHNLSCINPSLASIQIDRVDALTRTVAGKTPMIVHCRC